MDWINVKDRLPEEFQSVLGCSYDKYDDELACAVVYRCGAKWGAYDELLEASNYDGGAVIDLNSAFYITHWMPLPEPPEEE